MTKRFIVVGDVHGCLEEAQELIKKVKYNKLEDTLISLGDLVDRGPDPAGCVELFRSLGASLVMGNHEDKLLRWKAKQTLFDAGLKKKNDISLREHHKLSVESLNAHPNSKALWDYMELGETYLAFNAGGTQYECVHGGYLPFEGSNTSKKIAIRLRDITEDWKKSISYKGEDVPRTGVYWAEAWAGSQTVIFGHNVFSDVSEYPYAIGIDTGCTFGGKLTALVIDSQTGSREYFSVKAKQEHWVYHGDFTPPYELPKV